MRSAANHAVAAHPPLDQLQDDGAVALKWRSRRRVRCRHGSRSLRSGIARWRGRSQPVSTERAAAGSVVAGDRRRRTRLRRSVASRRRLAGDGAAAVACWPKTARRRAGQCPGRGDHVLYAPDGSQSPSKPHQGYRLFNAAAGGSAWRWRRMATPPRLFMLTRNAQPIAEGDRANPAHAVLWGLGRTLALEHPEIWGARRRCRRIGTRCSWPPDYVVDEAHSDDGEDQVVYRAGDPPCRHGCSGRAPAQRPRSRTRQGRQPSGCRSDRQHRTASDPAARRHGRRHRRRGVPQSGFATATNWPQFACRQGNDVGDGGGGRSGRSVRWLRSSTASARTFRRWAVSTWRPSAVVQ